MTRGWIEGGGVADMGGAGKWWCCKLGSDLLNLLYGCDCLSRLTLFINDS